MKQALKFNFTLNGQRKMMYGTPVIFGAFFKRVGVFWDGQYPISAEWGSSEPLHKKVYQPLKPSGVQANPLIKWSIEYTTLTQERLCLLRWY